MSNKFYTYAKQWGNSILYRGYNGTKQVIEKVPFKPTLYVNSKKSKSEWKSLYDNRPLEPIEFGDIKEAKNYIDTYKDVNGFEVHGFQRFEYQFIQKEFGGDISYDVSKVAIQFIDIEVVDADSESGFPDIQLAEVPVVLISIYNTIDNSTLVFGLKDYEKDSQDNFEYRKFSSEKELLREFIHYTQITQPDIWSGWNTDQFDIPYLINRLMRLFDEATVKKLSPFNIIREKSTNIRGKDIQTFEVFGIVSLDYLELYKKYGTYSAKESYALGFIAQEELGETKVELPGTSFRDAYNNYFDTFVRYNAKDSVLVMKLENKMKLIELAFAMAYMYHCNLNDIYRTVLPWEVFIFNHLASKKIAVPPKRNTLKGDFEGAWVKDGVKGMYGWCMTFDFASLYPSVIRQWNISPETFVPSEFDVKVKSFLENYTSNSIGKEATTHAIVNNYTIAANGTMYDKSRQGFLPELMEYCMVGRKVAKKEMIKLEEEYQKTKDKTLLPRIAALNNKQMALKIGANACYGAVGQEGFHYYDYRMAEAITLTGQLSDLHLAMKLNEKMNKLMKTEYVDYIIYGDTDSVFLDCQSLVKKYMNGKDIDEVVNFLDKFADEVCQSVINNSVNEIFTQMNAYDKVMGSKREAIASKMLFRGKKNYAMYVHNSEGIAYIPPKLKIQGIEIVRSSTPQWCRKKLKGLLQTMFEADEATVIKQFEEVETEYKTLSIQEIAFNSGVSEVEKYMDNGKLKDDARIPINSRAACLFNIHTKNLKKYQQLQNGDKIKFVYLKLPNTIKQNVIGFPSNIDLPVELQLTKYVDYEKQFEKTIESPMKSLTDCAGWKLREESSLESFFG